MMIAAMSLADWYSVIVSTLCAVWILFEGWKP